MAGSIAGDSIPSTGLGPQRPPLLVQPVEVAHVVVPLDGSPFAERALPVAAWVAAGLGADVHLVEVVPCEAEEEAEAAIRYLGRVARRHRAAAWDVVERNDVGAALADMGGSAPGRLACLATHGQGRSVLLGSVAVSLLQRSNHPVVLVGPVARAVTAADAPIVAAVDGTTRDDVLVSVALGWAARLGRRLDIVTVAEPAPHWYLEGARPRQTRGPTGPERYVESLAARADGAGVTTAPRVIYDPVSVQDGLIPFLNRTAALVVVGSRHRHGLGRMVLGSHAVRIVHDAAVPAVVVPLPPNRSRRGGTQVKGSRGE
ncbi:MAG TPA: universal stress protein [Acidimicrobiales bacterium]|nr:universal stress protein [Acidimicrobiales bacterium]